MLWSKNDFFKQQKADVNEAGRLKRLAHKRKVVKRLLEIKKFHAFEIDYFLEAYDYMVKNKNVFDGATIVKDVDDIPKLELSAMLHDYQYVALLPNFKGLKWFKIKKQFDKEYCNNLIKFGKIKHKRVAQIRYALLRISTPFYWFIKLF
jgi:hypothetical protein